MTERETYKAILMCDNCGKRKKLDIKLGHRLYTIQDKSFTANELDNEKGKKIDIENNVIICSHCGCSSRMNNITAKYPPCD